MRGRVLLGIFEEGKTYRNAAKPLPTLLPALNTYIKVFWAIQRLILPPNHVPAKPQPPNHTPEGEGDGIK